MKTSSLAYSLKNCVLVALEAALTLDDVHSTQCINDLKATGLKVCLLISFGGSRAEVKRMSWIIEICV